MITSLGFIHFLNTVDPDHLVSDGAIISGSTIISMQFRKVLRYPSRWGDSGAIHKLAFKKGGGGVSYPRRLFGTHIRIRS